MRTHNDGKGFRAMAGGDCRTIPARAREDGSGQPCIAVPVLTPDRPTKRQNGRRFKGDGEHRFTVTAQDRHGVAVGSARTVRSGGRGSQDDKHRWDVVSAQSRIRRLTPTECARLQGFPDDWADLGLFQNKKGEWHIREISDTGKYQCFGNAVTVDVIEAIITRMRRKGCLP